MTKHFITKASENAAGALSDAMYVLSLPTKNYMNKAGIQELVVTMNTASLQLKELCRMAQYRIEDEGKSL